MRSEDTSEQDRALRTVLAEWEIKESLPPRFQEQVWRRIAEVEEPGPVDVWTQVAQWIARAFARPSLAVSYVTVLLVAGLLAGYLQGQQKNNRAQHELSTRYVQMMSPYALRH
jgi:hypothetical protein